MACLAEGLLPEQHLVDACPNGPDVCLAAVLAVGQHLRSHVERRAQHGIREVLPCQQLREAKVGNLDIALVQQDVGQLEVPVHNLVVDQALEAVEDLAEEHDGSLNRQGPLLLHLRQEVAPVTILQHEVVVVGGLFEGEQLDDVRVVTGLEHLDLVLEQLIELAWMVGVVPFMRSLRMVLTATCCSESWCLPLKT